MQWVFDSEEFLEKKVCRDMLNSDMMTVTLARLVD